MGIITRMRKQRCVYWPPAAPGDYTLDGYGAPQVMRCRWEATQEVYQDDDGAEQVAKAKVFVEHAVVPKGYLWQCPSDLWDPRDASDAQVLADPRLPSNPQAKGSGAVQVGSYTSTPNLKASEFLQVALG